MSVVYTKEGRKRDLQTLIDNGNLSIGLYKNNLAPDLDTVLGDLTPCDFSGYVAFNIPGWTAVTINVDDNAEALAQIAMFIHDGGATANDVYGWYFAANFAVGDFLVLAERFGDAPRAMGVLDDEIDVTLLRTQGGCP